MSNDSPGEVVGRDINYLFMVLWVGWVLAVGVFHEIVIEAHQTLLPYPGGAFFGFVAVGVTALAPVVFYDVIKQNGAEEDV